MTDLEKVLGGLKSGKTPSKLARDLDMRKETIVAMIEFLVHQGKVREVDCDSACKSCPGGNLCAGNGAGREKMYFVIEKNENSV